MREDKVPPAVKQRWLKRVQALTTEDLTRLSSQANWWLKKYKLLASEAQEHDLLNQAMLRILRSDKPIPRTKKRFFHALNHAMWSIASHIKDRRRQTLACDLPIPGDSGQSAAAEGELPAKTEMTPERLAIGKQSLFQELMRIRHKDARVFKIVQLIGFSALEIRALLEIDARQCDALRQRARRQRACKLA